MQIKTQLCREVDFGCAGGCSMMIDDVNDDGIKEFICLQSPGIFQSSLYRGNPAFDFLEDNNQYLTCLTVFDQEGNVLWQFGTPHNGEKPYCSHSSNKMLAIGDIDEDGKKEIILIANSDRLIILDGSSGQIKKHVRLPADNFGIVKIIKTNVRGNHHLIMVKVGEQAYPPHAYANPILFYDTELRLVKQIDLKGAGHSPCIFDFDNDGYDEMVVGYNMIDHDLTLKWTLDFWQTRPIDAYHQHVDYIEPYFTENNWLFGFAGSYYFFLADSEGKTLWRKDLSHPQHCLIENFYPGNEPLIFVTNCSDGLAYIFDINGVTRWSGLLPEFWPKGRPGCVKMRSFHMDSPAEIWNDSGRKIIVYNEGGWPVVLLGDGDYLPCFPFPENAVQQSLKIPDWRPDDFGFGYQIIIDDFDEDGVQEVVIYDRRYAWIFKDDSSFE